MSNISIISKASKAVNSPNALDGAGAQFTLSVLLLRPRLFESNSPLNKGIKRARQVREYENVRNPAALSCTPLRSVSFGSDNSVYLARSCRRSTHICLHVFNDIMEWRQTSDIRGHYNSIFPATWAISSGRSTSSVVVITV